MSERSMPVLELDHAEVVLGGTPVLRGVSVTIRAGEVVAILGANGSGKSTLVRAALGLIPLTRGEARLFGRPVRSFTEWARVGYVPQRLTAASGVPATVAEVVSAGRLARRGFLRPRTAADRAAVTSALETVGLAARAADPVSTLSGGQQQRVLIARALAGEPELLVLDEPTAGVDAASQDAFATTLRELIGRGVTIALVAHELGAVEPLVGRAVVVGAGRIVHDGAVPRPAGHHADPDHEHLHPHAPAAPPGVWTAQ
ncbi:MAG: zinc transport system ATP-binding protein [Cryptosporangiaceae bacterium]|nr:zinc transport system ATP-binding protein [Cryptosporangiaceae bacterium]